MKPMRRSTKTFVLALTMLWTTALAALAQSVRGVVVDAVTLDTLAHATLQYADQPTPFSADAQGRFSLPRREGHVLRVSSVGYRTERVRITSRTSSRDLIIRLTPSDTQLAEVSVKAKRKKGYKRKGNPAVELMRRVIAAKERTNLERHDFYQYDKYQKITMAINNITPEELQGSLFASSPWLLGQVEVSEYNNQFVLPISVDETASTHLYRRHPPAAARHGTVYVHRRPAYAETEGIHRRGGQDCLPVGIAGQRQRNNVSGDQPGERGVQQALPLPSARHGNIEI